MKRKIVLILLAIIVLSMPFQSTYHQVDAAVASKAATLTAKKIAKEYIEDVAVNQAANFAVQQATDIIMGYQAKPGYKVVCPSGVSACTNPIQVKETLTETDRANIKAQASVEMDKAISPDGKGFPKWAKFMDWFLPIWLVGFGFTALTYALDPDVKSLFDEIGYNTLVALGIILPVDTSESATIQEKQEELAEKDKLNAEGVENTIFSATTTTTGTNVRNHINFPERVPENMIFKTYYPTATETDYFLQYHIFLNVTNNISIGNRQINMFSGVNGSTKELTISLNGQVISTQVNTSTSTNTFSLDTQYSGINIQQKKMESVQYRMPYKIGDFYYTDVLMHTSDGNVIDLQFKHTSFNSPSPIKDVYITTDYQQSGVHKSISAVYTGIKPEKRILPPLYDDISQEVGQAAESSYEDENGNVAMLPPAAFTYVEESTGEQVEKVKAPTGDGYVWQKPDGTQVPEENVIPKPEEEPKITPSPDGTPQYTPAPTPSNPAPEPVPLQPNPTTTPSEPPPTGTEEPPLEPFPDGAKCDAKLQFPIFSPLKEQLSTSFPFSIPWDIERAAQAAFGGISDEKPSFDMSIPIYKGEKFEFTITTPKFMDDWKPFTDSLLLITFDILIMFGLYRFVKGAGS